MEFVGFNDDETTFGMEIFNFPTFKIFRQRICSKEVESCYGARSRIRACSTNYVAEMLGVLE